MRIFSYTHPLKGKKIDRKKRSSSCARSGQIVLRRSRARLFLRICARNYVSSYWEAIHLLAILRRYAYYRDADDGEGRWEDHKKTCLARRTRSETWNDGTLSCDAAPFLKVAVGRGRQQAREKHFAAPKYCPVNLINCCAGGRRTHINFEIKGPLLTDDEEKHDNLRSEGKSIRVCLGSAKIWRNESKH